MCELDFPEELEAGRLDDDVLARAYEAVSPQTRARLKTTQTLVMSLFGETPDREDRRLVSFATGYELRVTRTPAPWALFFVENGRCGAARLTAALMAARLGGVESPVAVFSAREGLAPENLVALELCGIEDAFSLSAPDAAKLFRVLAAQGRGRLVGAGLPEALRGLAVKDGIPCHELPAAVRLKLDAALSPEEARAARELLPEAVDVSADGDGAPADIFIHQTSRPRDPDARLNVASPLSGCLADPDLLPSFFVNTAFSVSAL